MQNEYEELTVENYFKRASSIFPSVYLTIISIIQGVALGILGYNIFSRFNAQDIRPNWESIIPYSIISFITIIIVSYEYTWFIGIFRWRPRVLDILIPVSLGFFEFIPMFFLEYPDKWWIFTSIFCLIGAIAFLYTISNCKENKFRTCKQVYPKVRKELWGNVIISLSAFLYCFIVGILVLIKVAEERYCQMLWIERTLQQANLIHFPS
jgi:hypothetical protein